MFTMSRAIATVGLVSIVLLNSATPSMAGRYRTPSPEQSLFYEDLKSGKRASTKKILPPAQRKALETAPTSATSSAGTASATTVAPAAAATASPSTAFYFSAHADDFVLFMNPYRDASRNDTKAVFVFLTAGDAGLGKGPTGAPYYAARENGALRAVRFLADAASDTTPSPSTDRPRISGHDLRRWTYKNTVVYFLRLPDGAVEGVGYPLHNGASLMKLKTGEISTIRAIDGSTTYRSWTDLVNTLSEIVRIEAAGSPNVWLDVHENDTAASPGDHSDHLATGYAVAAVQPKLPCVNLAFHTGYATSGLVNLDLDDIENRAAAYGNYVSGLAEKGYPGVAWEPGHKSWLAGMINRLVNGNGSSCSF